MHDEYHAYIIIKIFETCFERRLLFRITSHLENKRRVRIKIQSVKKQISCLRKRLAQAQILFLLF